jgi:hypothetical protein
MRFETLKRYLHDNLLGTVWENVYIHPGPDDENVPPGAFILATRVGGPGMNTEYAIDGVGYQLVCTGDQHNFESAESLAFTVDAIMMNSYSQSIVTVEHADPTPNEVEWLVGIYRQGGGPVPLIVDDAERTRFVCSYIIDVESHVA